MQQVYAVFIEVENKPNRSGLLSIHYTWEGAYESIIRNSPNVETIHISRLRALFEDTDGIQYSIENYIIQP